MIAPSAGGSPRILLRVLAENPSRECWNEAVGEAAFTRWALTQTTERVSVYGVEDLVEEATCAAAHQLTRRLNHVAGKIWAVRIFAPDLDGLGIRVRDDVPGETGIAAVDERHRDLEGTAEAHAGLGSVVFKALHRGEDRVRRLDSAQVSVQLRVFLASELGVSDPARAWCRRALGGDG